MSRAYPNLSDHSVMTFLAELGMQLSNITTCAMPNYKVQTLKTWLFHFHTAYKLGQFH
jgi:hypothetical protein